MVNFAILPDRKVKMKESEKINKCSGLGRELLKQSNMGVTVIQIVVGGLGTVLKSLEIVLEELKIVARIEIN